MSDAVTIANVKERVVHCSSLDVQSNNTELCSSAVASVCSDITKLFSDAICAGEAYNDERGKLLGDCQTALEADGNCPASVPTNLANCVLNPFDTACATGEVASMFSRTDTTLGAIQTARSGFCVNNLDNNSLCESAIINTCGQTSDATDSALFGEELCAEAQYNDIGLIGGGLSQ